MVSFTSGWLCYITHMKLIDTHTHTAYSGHGEGTPKQLVTTAIQKQLSTLAITEHLPLPHEMDPEGVFSMLPSQVPLYRQEVQEACLLAQETDPQLEVICGVEIDWRDGAEGFILNQLQLAAESAFGPYQLLLGSVHMLTGEDPTDGYSFWPLDFDGAIDGWYSRGSRTVWERYVAHWLDAVNSKVPFDIMTHPDLPKKLGFKPDFDARPLWRQMAEAAAAAGLMIELNTSGLFNICTEVYPGPDLLAEFCRADVPCTISSDAHLPGNVNRAFQEAVLALVAAGYRHVTVPTADGDRQQIALL